MTTETIVAESKSQLTAKKRFDEYDHIQEIAVILKGDIEAEVSIHCRERGQLISINFPCTYDLEFAAQQLMRRWDIVRKEIVYA